ncbi:LGALS1, partial [Lemmus lemmus]
CLKVCGKVTSKAKSYVLNPCKDSNNLSLHINPLQCPRDTNAIVINSKCSRAWGSAEPAFPFQPGSTMDGCINFSCYDLDHQASRWISRSPATSTWRLMEECILFHWLIKRLPWPLGSPALRWA